MDPVWVVVGVVGLVAILVVVDRLTAAGVFDRRDADRPRERRAGGAPLGDALGGLHDVFDPSHRHLTDAQQRERSTSVQVPGEAPPLIDLDSGLAVLPSTEPPASGTAPAPEPPTGGLPANPPHAADDRQG
jgi:hypothetical protein